MVSSKYLKEPYRIPLESLPQTLKAYLLHLNRWNTLKPLKTLKTSLEKIEKTSRKPFYKLRNPFYKSIIVLENLAL